MMSLTLAQSEPLVPFPGCLGLFWLSVPALSLVELHLLCLCWGSVGVWSFSTFFSTSCLARLLGPLSSKAFSFWFLIAFSSLNNLPLAFQKRWLSKVLFLIWDQELILEVRIEHRPFLSLCIPSVLILLQVLWELYKEGRKRKVQTFVWQGAFSPWH